MYNALVAKINTFTALSAADERLIEHACDNQRDVAAQQDLIREGDGPDSMIIIVRGWACRYKLLREGTRQITAFLMPGDCADTHISVLGVMEHTVSTLTPCRVATVSRTRMQDLIATRPALARAFWWSQLVTEDTLRAWMVSMGRRNSTQRVAHLMCELYTRGGAVGLTHGNTMGLDLTHAELGDSLGLTAVHVCRVLRKLRVAGLMELRTGILAVHDLGGLTRLAGFDAAYLHQPAEAFEQRRSG